MRAFPGDDITFVLLEKSNMGAQGERPENMDQILQKMMGFETLGTDYAGIADNCIYEIEEAVTEWQKVLNLKEVPIAIYTAVSFRNLVLDPAPRADREVGAWVDGGRGAHEPQGDLKGDCPAFPQGRAAQPGADLISGRAEGGLGKADL
jgi:hypothetical protein